MIWYFLRQFTLAMTVAAGLLLVGEILMPGLVLPFLNLHLLVIGVLGLNLLPIPHEQEMHSAWSLIPIIPVGLVLIAYVYLLLSGNGPSATLLGIALVAMIIAGAVAISTSYAKH